MDSIEVPRFILFSCIVVPFFLFAMEPIIVGWLAIGLYLLWIAVVLAKHERPPRM